MQENLLDLSLVCLDGVRIGGQDSDRKAYIVLQGWERAYKLRNKELDAGRLCDQIVTKTSSEKC